MGTSHKWHSTGFCSWTNSVHNRYVYINGIDSGLNNIISTFTDDTKLGNSITDDRDRLNLQEDREKFQNDLKGGKGPLMSTNVTFFTWVQKNKNLIMR